MNIKHKIRRLSLPAARKLRGGAMVLSVLFGVGLCSTAGAQAISPPYAASVTVMGVQQADLSGVTILCIGDMGDILQFPATAGSSISVVGGCTSPSWSLMVSGVPTGYQFVQWTSANATITNPTDPMLGNAVYARGVTLIATFAKIPTQLTVSSVSATADFLDDDGCSVKVNTLAGSAGLVAVTYPFSYGDEVTLTPVPATGYTFIRFGIDDLTAGYPEHPNVRYEATANPPGYKITMSQDEEVVAVFGERITITQTRYDPNNPAATVNYPDVVLDQKDVVVRPPESPKIDSSSASIRHYVTGWTGGSGDIPATGIGESILIPSITQKSTVTWIWEIRYAFDVYWTPGGTVQLSLGNGFYQSDPVSENRYWFRAGATTTITAHELAGYHFTGWTSSQLSITAARNPVLAIAGGLDTAAIPNEPILLNADFRIASPDSNNDGIPDWWCERFGLDPFAEVGDASHAFSDPDNDGLTNIEEYRINYTSEIAFAFCNPLNWDTDDDGMDDNWEFNMFFADPSFNQGYPPPLDDGSKTEDGRFGAEGNPDEDYLWDTTNGWEMETSPLYNLLEYIGPDDAPPLLDDPANPITLAGITKPVRRAIQNPDDTGDSSHPLKKDSDKDEFDDGFEYSWDKWQRLNENLRMTDRDRDGPPYWPGITETVVDLVGPWADGNRPFHPTKPTSMGENLDWGYMYNLKTGRVSMPYNNREEYSIWQTTQSMEFPVDRSDEKPAGSTDRWCTNPFLWDTDDDGMPDGWEVSFGYNPWNPTTFDGVPDAEGNPDCDAFAFDGVRRHHAVYQTYGYNPMTTLRDPDDSTRLPKNAENTEWYNNFHEMIGATIDNMGDMATLTLTNQLSWLSTSPWSVDFDGDGMYDTWELYVGLDPFTDTDAGVDLDDDKLLNFAEFDSAMTPPPPAEGLGPVVNTVPAYRVEGWFNKVYPTDPNDGDTDGDQIADGGEREVFNVFTQPDEGWVTYMVPPAEDDPPPVVGTILAQNGGLCPTSVDTDGDHLPDAWEGVYGVISYTVTITNDAAEVVSTNFPGLNGTIPDAHEDHDNDGLLTYQEYMTGAIYHWQFLNNIGETIWSPNLGLYGYEPYDYFDIGLSQDMWFLGNGGRGAKHWDPFYEIGESFDFPFRFLGAAVHLSGLWFSTTDPMDRDTDMDGMDDYWEIFHGLNPLYGTLDILRSKVAGIYVDAASTAVLDEFNMLVGGSPDVRTRPWLAGFPYTDTDQDQIQDLEESLQPNNERPPFHHSDPSPLWVTDISSPESWVNKYYWTGFTFGVPGFQWPWVDPGEREDPPSYFFSFEMNEGFDTDGDFIADSAENVSFGGIPGVTDPINPMLPPKRRTLYLDGVDAAARTMPQYSHDVWDLRQFSLDAWIRPEQPVANHEQIILERVGAIPQGSHDLYETVVRANFRLGIDKTGHPFVEYDGSAAANIFPSPRATGSVILQPNTWYHLAATYDGQMQSSGNWVGTLRLFVNGNSVGSQNTSVIPINGWTIAIDTSLIYDGYVVPMALVVGASDANPSGWVNGSEILVGPGMGLSYYPPDLGNYYRGWVDQVRVWRTPLEQTEIKNQMKRRYRTPFEVAELAVAPAAGGLGLLYCFTFDNLVDPVNSDVFPKGFDAITGRPVAYTGVPFWQESPVRSEVYTEYNYLPWIKNLVAHIPLETPRDMGAPDNTQTDPDAYYPNAWNPYGFVYKTATSFRREFHPLLSSSGGVVDVFQDMANVPHYPDLLPLRWARADENLVMWDGWTGTDPLYDLDGDGLPDEWEMAYGLDPATPYTGGSEISDPEADLDGDGLSNWVEYLLGTNPLDEDSSGDEINDYDNIYKFITDGSAFNYIDMDFIEDWWENKFSVDYISANRYDPHLDRDGDGWDNWSEARARTRPDTATSTGVNGPQYEHPVPVLNLNVWCDAQNREGNLVVHAYSTPTMDGVPDAVYTTVFNEQVDVPAYTMELHAYYAMTGRLLPGHIRPGSLYITAVDGATGAPITIHDYMNDGKGTLYLMVPVVDEDGQEYNEMYDVGELDYLSGVYTIDLTEVMPGGHGSAGIEYSYQITPEWPSPISFSLKEPDAMNHSLRQGNNYFFAFLDNNKNGEWDMGEPACLAEQNLRAPAPGGTGVIGEGLSGAYIGWHENQLDFGLRTKLHGFPRAFWPATGEDVTVTYTREGSNSRDLFSVQVKAPRNYVHEGDILYAQRTYPGFTAGYGLDWGFRGIQSGNNTNTYQIAVAGSAMTLMTTNFSLGYVRSYNASTLAPVYPRDGTVVETAALEFRWKMPEDATAFELTIQGSGTEYSTGKLPPPFRRRESGATSHSVCVFTPDLFASELLLGGTYSWYVTVWNPSVVNGTTTIVSGRTVTETFAVSDKLGETYRAFTLDVELNYFTPSARSGSGRPVYVEAFDNAGFAGLPAARARTTLTAVRPYVNTVSLRGLNSEKGYYVRAYIDTDNNRKRDAYDSWGYVCAPEANGWVYDPLRITDGFGTPVYTLKMYDTDIDMDKRPDIQESLNFSTMSLSNFEFSQLIEAYAGDNTDTDGDGVLDWEEKLYGLDPLSTSSGNDGISDYTRVLLGLYGSDPVSLVIDKMPMQSNQLGVSWTLGTSVQGAAGDMMQTMGVQGAPTSASVFTPLSTPLKSTVTYVIEHTESLANPKWLPVDQIPTSQPSGTLHFQYDATKSSGFFRVRMQVTK